MTHCELRVNGCDAEECTCVCDGCWGEKNYERGDFPDVDAAGNCYSDADPGL